MDKLELLKKMIADVCNNEANYRNIYQTDECLFVVNKDCIYVLYEKDFEDMNNYFIPDFTEEESKEAKKIAKDINLNRHIYLPIVGGVVSDLESLIEYYEDDDKYEEKAEEINKLIKELSQENSIFYNCEHKFLDLFLYPHLESGIAYVHSEWDHDEAYYYHLPFRTGVEDPLYEVIENEWSIVLPDIIDELENDEEVDEECNYWIYVLSNLNNFILLRNQ